MSGRIMGMDYGTRTVGVAVSDELGITAQGLETIFRKSPGKLRQTLARIQELSQEYHVSRIVVGLPKNMNNSLGERAEDAMAFSEMVKKRCGLPVEMWDERLTTAQSERILIEGGVRREKRKKDLDRMAAALILQSYMDGRSAADQDDRSR